MTSPLIDKLVTALRPFALAAAAKDERSSVSEYGLVSRGALNNARAALAEAEAAKGDGWHTIDSAPHAKDVLLGWYETTGEWKCELGQASHGWRNQHVSNMSYHSWATHWRELPAPPSDQT